MTAHVEQKETGTVGSQMDRYQWNRTAETLAISWLVKVDL